MKIIFENEDEKDELLTILEESSWCPSYFNLRELDDCHGGDSPEECRKCWRNSDIELTDSEMKKLKGRLDRLKKYITGMGYWEEGVFSPYGAACLTPNDMRFLKDLPDVKDPVEKPPLGVMPIELWNEKRKNEIAEASARYIESGRPIPAEWIEEYIELVKGGLETDE